MAQYLNDSRGLWPNHGRSRPTEQGLAGPNGGLGQSFHWPNSWNTAQVASPLFHRAPPGRRPPTSLISHPRPRATRRSSRRSAPRPPLPEKASAAVWPVAFGARVAGGADDARDGGRRLRWAMATAAATYVAHNSSPFATELTNLSIDFYPPVEISPWP